MDQNETVNNQNSPEYKRPNQKKKTGKDSKRIHQLKEQIIDEAKKLACQKISSAYPLIMKTRDLMIEEASNTLA